MPSITPETLTAVQRAERLNLRQNPEQASDPAQGAAPDASMTSKKQQQHIAQARAAFASALGTQRNATADIDPKRDADLSFAILPIDQLAPYEHNPRSGVNPRYEEIKESIRVDGITNTLTVTRRNPQAKYTTYGGGNTRLKIAKELHAEGDQRFATLQVIVKNWPGDAQVIAAHLSENELRGDITFWDKARGVQQFRTEFEAEHGKPLTASELNKELKARGLNYGIKTLQNFAFAVEHLAPLANWLQAREVNETLRPAVASLLDMAAKFSQTVPVQQAMNAAMQQRADELDALVARNAELDPSEHVAVQLDVSELLSQLRAAVAGPLGVDAHQLTAMQAALAADPRITAGALRGVQAAPNVPVPPAESAPEATAAAAGLPGAVTQQLSAASPQLADAGVAPAPTPRTTPPHLPQQAPLAGMLAPVAAPDMPPQINPDDPAAHALAQAPAQHRSEAQQIEAIRTAMGRIDALVPLSDVLLSTDEMPFGYLVDLPPESLRLYGDQPAQLPGLRASLWRLLVALSCQCDVRLTKRLPADQVAWAGAYQQGKEVFEQELWQRTGTRFAGLMPAMGMDELSVVLTAPQLGEVVIQLLQAMEELRRRFPTRIPEQIKPLFSSGEG
ncbi:MAG TPA: ParB N-terminal domain-containing protein [Acidovorax temperans]|jgi:ParB family protein of integrating conjugative element (PFGI_1 class)|nr:ParB N-terminal domain-containing protein [Acidovorax temperans]